MDSTQMGAAVGLDVTTLLVVNVANTLAMAVLLPVIMGAQLSPAARNARLSLIAVALGWVFMILSGSWPGQWQDRLLSIVSIACISSGNALLYLALSDWLGPRPLRRTIWLLVPVITVGYGLLFPSYEWRVGWSNFLLAVQLFICARAALWTGTSMHGRWRVSIAVCMVTVAVLTFMRGYLGAFTDLYPNFAAPNSWNIAAMLAANVAQVVTTLSILVAWREEAELELRRQAVTDVLTGLLNRRGWGELAVPQLASAHRHGIAVALLAIDLDHFKRINDVYGHAVGDQALRLLGRLLQKEQRAGDCVARLGGEEFGMLLSYTGVEAAARFDARLRAAVRAATLAELGFALEFSSGLAALRENESMEDLLKRADAACYFAKSQGRGRLVLAESENFDAQLQTA